ncbi:MAG: hypothetical protein BGO43_12520 [Gammaproteobacteria bacterium 39-13]|nr:hypothetical protein [Gammaproteobacteria bacterium]OJV89972.1 MAG: hypothetical protein BGO43_12520 [Gammaproteobacteria bacterium 39-13]
MTEFTYICTDIKHYSHDISLLSLHPATDKKIIYRAGQYVEMVISNNMIIPLSIANMPTAEGRIEFHLRHDQKHPQAQHVISQLSINTAVHLRGPFGRTTLASADSTKRLLFLAGGTGFAPIKALLEEALFTQQQNDPLYLYWGIRKPQDSYQEKLLLEWQQKFPHFRYTLVLSEPQQFPHWQGPSGLVHEYLTKEHSHLIDYYIYASGPYEMIKAAQNHFRQQGLAGNQLISDML